jgi:amidase
MRVHALALLILLPPAAQAEEVTVRLAELQSERLRKLDFAPFAESLAGFQPSSGMDGFLMVAGIPDIQRAMAEGELSSETLTLWHLARIRRHDETLRGMLDGIPVSLKDNIGTAGPMHTTANAEILFDRVAANDATLVASLRAAGAVIIGKASLSEFAGSLASGYPSGGNGAVGGQGVNPLGPFPTYGSSSGSAISVAAHFSVVSIGTETAGSLVAPAGVMSLVGMKPSTGLVSTEGVVPLIASNDGPGPMARTVQDAALLLAAADTAEVDYAAGLSADALTGVRVGVLLADIADAGMGTEAMTRTAAALVMLGADTAPVTLDVSPGAIRQFFPYLSAGMRNDMMPVVSAHNPGVVTLEDLIAYNREDPKRRMPFGQDLLEKFAPLSAERSAADYAKLTADMHKVMTEAMDAAFAAHGGMEVLVSMANLHSIFYATAGYPAITVPIGRKDSGEPVGVTLIGKKGQDALLLSYAYAFEQATRAHIPADLP